MELSEEIQKKKKCYHCLVREAQKACSDGVMYLLQTMYVSKTSGPDQISGRMLKNTATSIAAPVTKLFNQLQSILTGCFAVMWK